MLKLNRYLISSKFRPNVSFFSLSCIDFNEYFPKLEYGPMEVHRSYFNNGIKVAAARPLGHQIAACTIMYQIGSRHERDDQLGASHFIRVCANGSGSQFSSFSKMRVLQQHGAFITCSSDRQTTSFTLRCPPTAFNDLKDYFLDMVCSGCYNQWEVDDRKPIIRDHLEMMSPEQRVLDLIQKASWTGPLSNSVFCEEARIDDMTENSLKCFVSSNFKTCVCTVGSCGVPFDDTLRLAERMEFRTERPAEPITEGYCPRGGFELYDLGPDADTWIAVAVPGCGTADLGCLMKHAILAAACGTGNQQVGQHELDRIPQSPLGLLSGNDIFTHYKAFNISYRDTGLFGVIVKSPASTAYAAAKSAGEFLATVENLQWTDIEVGKRRLKLSMALNDEDCVNVSEGLALQLADNIQFDSAKNSIELIDAISADDVRCTAQTISSKRGCMAVAVVGDVTAVPTDREIVCV